MSDKAEVVAKARFVQTGYGNAVFPTVTQVSDELEISIADNRTGFDHKKYATVTFKGSFEAVREAVKNAVYQVHSGLTGSPLRDLNGNAGFIYHAEDGTHGAKVDLYGDQLGRPDAVFESDVAVRM